MDLIDLSSEDHRAGKLSVMFMDEASTICEWDVTEILRSSVVSSSQVNATSMSSRSVKSPAFCHSLPSKWCMELRTGMRYLSLCFHLLSSESNKVVEAEVKASLLMGGVVKDVYTTRILRLYIPGSSWLQNFDVWEELKSHEFDLKIQGEVRVPCLMGETLRRSGLHGDPRIVADDLGELLDSGHLSDIELYVGGSRMRAHRLLLSARSPVFAAMLRHDTREAQTGRIEITDVDPETMREVLHYIYTGKAPRLFRTADRLLVAADKYDLQKLKELCEVELAKNLTVVNAASTAVIAVRHSCDLLKRCALNFIRSNVVLVLNSEGWADAVINHPKVVVEMSRLYVNFILKK